MQRFLRYFRFLLPVGFLAYALYLNLAVFGGNLDRLKDVSGDLITGEAAASFSDLYSRAIPHRKPAIAWLGAGRYLALGEGRAGVTVGDDGWLFTDEEMVAAEQAEIDRVASWAAAARAELASDGTDLVVIPVPAKADIYRDRGAPAYAGPAMEEQYQRFREALARAGVASVDTRPALRKEARNGQIFLARDTHWTPAGASAVAAAVAASGLIEEGTDRFVARPAVPEERLGDLVTFVTSESLAPTIGLGPERVAPFVAELADGPKGGIFAADTTNFDTVLVGTSYSADDRWSFVPALKLSLERDVLNLAQEGQGPLRPMADFLEELAAGGAAPDRILWEFPVRYLADPNIWPDPDPLTSPDPGGIDA
ncbi:alginate O-acetyltransferase AlgX-related protein [Roseibium salinum]|uniref:AlgX/AlgJ SGNH hydrolase-like domain-containing protein n=1 Tax=Roseibium salinum TaxID=1604349 RepID=A0ABT3QWP1_9HYPH|nr:hypothetical protein [Roseibium sp. DSM 29163]MCX2721344.1 hypothetical protein [Roseibium sp. DSM 29163]